MPAPPYGSAGHSILKDWKISEKVCGGITDNESNIVNAIGLKAQLPNSSMICSSSKVSHVLTQSKEELNLYKAEQPADLDSNPLAWWKEQKSLYPLMSKLVQKVFSLVATHVRSQWVFSTSGNVITKKHNCLTSEHADQVIFLFENFQ